MTESLLKIRLLRTALNISQYKIALALGIEQCTYSRIERGESPMHLEHLFGLASVFCVGFNELCALPLEQLILLVDKK